MPLTLLKVRSEVPTPRMDSMRPRSNAPVSFFIAIPPSVAMMLFRPPLTQVMTFDTSMSLIT